MLTWETALVIAVVVAAVHMVHRYAHKQGYEHGIMVGRQQILEENSIRSGYADKNHTDMVALVAQIVEAEEVRMNKYNNIKPIKENVHGN